MAQKKIEQLDPILWNKKMIRTERKNVQIVWKTQNRNSFRETTRNVNNVKARLSWRKQKKKHNIVIN